MDGDPSSAAAIPWPGACVSCGACSAHGAGHRDRPLPGGLGEIALMSLIWVVGRVMRKRGK